MPEACGFKKKAPFSEEATRSMDGPWEREKKMKKF